MGTRVPLPDRSQALRDKPWQLGQWLCREQPAPHLLSQLSSCPAFGAWPLLGASSDDFLPPGETNPPMLLLQAGTALPGQLPLWGIAQQGSAQLVSHWGPGHVSPRVSPCPQDPVTTLLCIGTNLWWDRCHSQG